MARTVASARGGAICPRQTAASPAADAAVSSAPASPPGDGGQNHLGRLLPALPEICRKRFRRVAFGLAAAALQHQEAWPPHQPGNAEMDADISRMEHPMNAGGGVRGIEQARDGVDRRAQAEQRAQPEQCKQPRRERLQRQISETFARERSCRSLKRAGLRNAERGECFRHADPG
ncbi:MAG TPA: hypothetical protein VFA03_05965 [Acetobacteraceae bacterium]|nr:hypothetical protein [Acetobacteraceae bacterium]